MRIQITMWGPHNTWKGWVLDGMYGIRGLTGADFAIALYSPAGKIIKVDIPDDAVFCPTDQPSGRAYRPEDNEYDPTGTYWQIVK